MLAVLAAGAGACKDKTQISGGGGAAPRPTSPNGSPTTGRAIPDAPGEGNTPSRTGGTGTTTSATDANGPVGRGKASTADSVEIGGTGDASTKDERVNSGVSTGGGCWQTQDPCDVCVASAFERSGFSGTACDYTSVSPTSDPNTCAFKFDAGIDSQHPEQGSTWTANCPCSCKTKLESSPRN